jgi:hypothetical protein
LYFSLEEPRAALAKDNKSNSPKKFILALKVSKFGHVPTREARARAPFDLAPFLPRSKAGNEGKKNNKNTEKRD